MSSLGIISADLQGDAWLHTLLLQPMERLLWPRSCRTGPWSSPLVHGAKEMKSHHRALGLSDKCSRGRTAHTLSVQCLFRERICIHELVISNVDSSVLFPSSCKLAWQ